MTLDRDTVLRGLSHELQAFGDLLGTLPSDALDRRTRCANWCVGDVAGHVVGTVVDVVDGRLDGQGTPAVTERQANERAGRTALELIAELTVATPRLVELLDSLPAEAWDGPSLSDPAYTLGFAVEAIWFDAYVHGDDIRAAVGTPSVRGAGLVCAVHHVAGYLEHRGGDLRLELGGFDSIRVGDGKSLVRGDAMAFVLAATGRADPAPLGLDASINVYDDSR